MATPISNLQPGLGLNSFIAQGGVFPAAGDGTGTDGGSSGALLGVIGLTATNFGPYGAFLTQGQSVASGTYPSLFSLLGTTFGGDGAPNFQLPNLNTKLSIDTGQGAGLSTNFAAGAQTGGATIALTQANLPAQEGGTSVPYAEAQASLASNFYVVTSGLYPSNFASPTAVGTVVEFSGNYAPRGMLPADGRSLLINDFGILYTLIGTTFGGDGVTTFFLPDLRGRTIIGTDATHLLGSVSGGESTTLTNANLPANMGGSGVPVGTLQPSIALNYLIATDGAFPNTTGSGGLPDDAAFLGQIITTLYNFVPQGYARADGALLSIAQNNTLFALLGTNFGGNGQTNFNLPNLGGRAPVGPGTDPVSGLTVALGQNVGTTTTSIGSANIPSLNIPGTAADDVFFGGDDPDQLTGALGNDSLTGNGGDDTLNGGIGNDTLDGGAGNDTATYATAAAGVTVILLSNSAQPTGGAGTDTLINVESIIGSGFADTLLGTAGANTLSGGMGDDRIEGGDGPDSLDGGGGIDLLAYTSATGGITVSLALPGGQVTGGAGIDTVANFENLRGSAFGDVLGGDAGANVIEGDAGDDTMNGAGGIDTASYFHAGSGVFVGLLTTGAQNTQGAGTDTLSNFTNLQGSDFNDTLGGDASANVLTGGSGNDQLFGDAADDTLQGGAGDDVMYGGTGNDSMVGGQGDDSYVVNDIGDLVVEAPGGGSDTVFVTVSGWTLPAEVETVYLYGGVTTETGGAGAEVLVANASGTASSLDGGGGDDVLWGLGGDDTLTGGLGNDVLRGQGGNDTLNGGAGNDQLVGGTGADNFVFDQPGWGYDQVFDFAQGSDKLDMRGSGATFATLTLYSSGVSSAVIFGAARIDVYSVATLTASDFIFS